MYIYYVYAYLRNKDSKNGKKGTPYYIGKGKKNRAFAKHGNLPVPSANSNIVFLETTLSEIGALALERRMIAWYGRIDLGTGLLHNLTDGGDGCSPSIATREKLRLANIGKTLSAETCAKMSISRSGTKNHFFGKTHSDESISKIIEKRKYQIMQPCSASTKDKIRNAQLGIPRGSMSSSGKILRSLANKGVPKTKITCPHCLQIGGISQMKRWHFKNCKLIKPG